MCMDREINASLRLSVAPPCEYTSVIMRGKSIIHLMAHFAGLQPGFPSSRQGPLSLSGYDNV